jgi:hypothetical protein
MGKEQPKTMTIQVSLPRQDCGFLRDGTDGKNVQMSLRGEGALLKLGIRAG